MIPIPLVILTATVVALCAAGCRLEHLVVRDRSWLWRGVLVVAAVDAVPAAITGNWWARVAVLVGVDASWRLLDGRVPPLPRRTRPASLPDNVIPLQRPQHSMR